MGLRCLIVMRLRLGLEMSNRRLEGSVQIGRLRIKTLSRDDETILARCWICVGSVAAPGWLDGFTR
jgi:hypothetical protein